MGFHGKQIQPGTLPIDRINTSGYVPSAANDLTNVAYVQALFAGLDPKGEARVRATGNIDILSPPANIDTVVMNEGDRVVLGDQTDPVENGCWDYHAAGMVRSADFDGSPLGEVKVGAFLYIQEGATWSGYGFFVSGTPATPPNIVVGTDPIIFSTLQRQNPYVADNGITLTGNSFELGGNLAHDTTIDGMSLHSMTLANLASYEVSTPGYRMTLDKGGSVARIENAAGTQQYLDIKSGYRISFAIDDGGGAGQVNADYSVNLAANGIINDTHTVNAARNTTFAVGSKYGFAAGRNHTIGNGAGTSGDTGTALGIDSLNYGEAGITSGVGSRITYMANQRGGIAHGMSTGTGLKPVGVPYVTAVAGAVNISRNTVTQVDGNGALAQDSVILGGFDHHIPANSPGTVILGGSGIIARALDPNQVYITNLNIMAAPATGIGDNNILVRDGVTGQIKQIEQSSIVATINDGSGTTGASGGANWGGILTQDAILTGSGFGVGQEYTNGGFWNVYNYQGDNTTLNSNLSMLPGDFEQMVFDPGVWQGVFTISSSGFGNGQNIRLQANDLSMASSTTMRISIGEFEISSDAPNFAGIQYLNDYVGNYTARSLVDKAYVDGLVAGGTGTASNGLTKVASDFQLGGTLTQNTGIDGEFELIFGSIDRLTQVSYRTGNSAGTTLDMNINTQMIVVSDDTVNATTVSASVTPIYVAILAQADGYNTLLQINSNVSNNGAISVSGTNPNFVGVEYGSDYSANYTNRSLVDKEYVDNQIAGSITASNGLTKTINDVQLGGVLTLNTTIDKAGFEFRIENVTGDDGGIFFRTSNTAGVTDSTLQLDSASAFIYLQNNGNYVGVDLLPTYAALLFNSPSGSNYLEIGDGTMTIHSAAPTFNGVQYFDDYSANYTNRSLVDKEYVDNAVSGGGGYATVQAAGTPLTQRTILNAFNGLTAIDDAVNSRTNIGLGGSLAANAMINGGGWHINWGINGNRMGDFRVWSGTSIALDATAGALMQVGGVSVSLSTTIASIAAPTVNISSTTGDITLNSTQGRVIIQTNFASDDVEINALGASANIILTAAQGLVVAAGDFSISGTNGGSIYATDPGAGITLESTDGPVNLRAGTGGGAAIPNTINISGADINITAVQGDTNIYTSPTANNGISNYITTVADSTYTATFQLSATDGTSSTGFSGTTALGSPTLSITSTAVGLLGNSTITINASIDDPTQVAQVGIGASDGTGGASIAILSGAFGHHVSMSAGNLPDAAIGRILQLNTSAAAPTTGHGGLIEWALYAEAGVTSNGGLAYFNKLSTPTVTEGAFIFRVNDSLITTQDILEINLNGAFYGADYSANYTNRSLVDKEYVDSLIAGTLPAPQAADKDLTPSVTAGDEQTTGLTITNTPKGLLIVAVNGEIMSIGNGVKTKKCYFSADGGVTARTLSAIVAGDTLYWNGTIASLDLDTSDRIDLYYI